MVHSHIDDGKSVTRMEQLTGEQEDLCLELTLRPMASEPRLLPLRVLRP